MLPAMKRVPARLLQFAVALAGIGALAGLRSPDDIAAKRGKSVEDILG